ncbi:MAG: hypothetical protein LBF56_01355 [Holosporales bacterium]|jgi:predicted component of type VI protein secretion system|nr:hypothetical protein [Holosporales bacterium]
MSIAQKIDAPFLSKFIHGKEYLDSAEEICRSITEEIGNILSTRLTLSGDHANTRIKDSPYRYGVRDLQSVGVSSEDLEKYKAHCKEAILASESRLYDLEIESISFIKEMQSLQMSMSCVLKGGDYSFLTEISLHH